MADKVHERIDPTVREVITLLGVGTLLTAGIIFPGLGVVFKEYNKHKIERDRKEWSKFNLWRLRQVIKRLEQQKVIEITDDLVQITDKGRKKILKFKLEEMVLKKETDGRWRLIIYDIADLKKYQRELFRSFLKKLKLLPIQESVYLTPFKCEEEIEYLRQLFGIGNEVLVLKVVELENEQAYKDYFGI